MGAIFAEIARSVIRAVERFSTTNRPEQWGMCDMNGLLRRNIITVERVDTEFIASIGMSFIGILVVSSLVFAFVNGVIQRHNAIISSATYWMETGRSCPSTNPAAFSQSNDGLRNQFSFIGVNFTRNITSAVRCAGVASDWGRGSKVTPVCLFNSPGILDITTRRGRFVFGPRLYRPVTVSVDDGRPRCVLNADYRHAADIDF